MFIILNGIIQQKQNLYYVIVVPAADNFTELEQLVPNFRENYIQFSNAVSAFKNSIISFLQNGGELNINLQTFSASLANIIRDKGTPDSFGLFIRQAQS